MPDYPKMIVPVDHVEPVPRRVRATLGGEVVLDTINALYVWEWPFYPQYYIPLSDIQTGVLVDEDHPQRIHRGLTRLHRLEAGGQGRPSAARLYVEPTIAQLADTVHLEWAALDHWFEEEEEVFVHPRNPYVRVDALRSARPVRVELDGVALAESGASVMVFETGLPTRYYFDRSAVNFAHLVPSETTTACPYKGVTSQYWSVRIADRTYPDLAWAYDFPTRQLLPIAGLVAFYDEKVDVAVDGVPQERPQTHFSK